MYVLQVHQPQSVVLNYLSKNEFEFFLNFDCHIISEENEMSHCFKSKGIVFVPFVTRAGRKNTVKNINVNLMKPQKYLYWNLKQYYNLLNSLIFF